MKTRIKNDFWLLNHPSAHRGLHDGNKLIAENSPTAFKLAIENGHPIETDVQQTADGKLICFHDDNLKRITGVDCLVSKKTLAEIKTLKLAGTNDTVLTFEEFLSLVDGKVPLLIEIKTSPLKGIADKVIEVLKNYKGEFVIQSFDPIIMYRVKKLAPNIIRGQLATPFAGNCSAFKKHVIKNMSLNFLVKPDFINYDLNGLPLKKSVRKTLPLICWTVRTEEEKARAEKLASSYVFELIKP